VAATLRIDGLAELRRALLALPPDLVREAGVIVQAQAEAAAGEMARAYPVHTGNLRRGLRIEVRHDVGTAKAIVRNRAKHAWIFEKGTKPRRWKTGKKTGTMPAGRVFIPIAIQRRRIMVSALIDLVERAGLKVTAV
jgi:Bacteriophage HK97-gp10, putative tail-component